MEVKSNTNNEQCRTKLFLYILMDAQIFFSQCTDFYIRELDLKTRGKFSYNENKNRKAYRKRIYITFLGNSVQTLACGEEVKTSSGKY